MTPAISASKSDFCLLLQMLWLQLQTCTTLLVVQRISQPTFRSRRGCTAQKQEASSLPLVCISGSEASRTLPIIARQCQSQL